MATNASADSSVPGVHGKRRLSSHDLLLWGVVLVWGFNYVTVKLGLREVAVGPFNVMRYGLSAPVMWLAVLLMKEDWRLARRDIPRAIWAGVVGVTVYPFVFSLALQHSTSANVALLLALSPIFTSIFEAMGGRQALTRRFALGTLIAATGTGLMILYGGGRLDFSPATLLGNLIGLVAAIIWGYYPSMAQPLLARYSAITVQAWMMTFGVIGLLIWQGAPAAQVHWLSISTVGWLSILFTAVLASVYAQIAWYGGVRALGASHVMSYMYLIPAAAAFAGALCLGEGIHVQQLVGAGVALVGVWQVKLGVQVKATTNSTAA